MSNVGIPFFESNLSFCESGLMNIVETEIFVDLEKFVRAVFDKLFTFTCGKEWFYRLK